MKLFVMRHAQASFDAPSDQLRPITELGAKQTKFVFERSSENFKNVQSIWSSKLLRAKQTAKIASGEFDLEVQEKAFLSPDDEPSKVIEELALLNQDACVLIVSHQPLVGELVGLLVHNNIHQAHPYTTSEIIELDMDFAERGMATKVRQYLPS